MGILTTYAIYKYGKSKAEKRCAESEQEQNLICDHCGYKLHQHSDDGNQSCPTF